MVTVCLHSQPADQQQRQQQPQHQQTNPVSDGCLPSRRSVNELPAMTALSPLVPKFEFGRSILAQSTGGEQQAELEPNTLVGRTGLHSLAHRGNSRLGLPGQVGGEEVWRVLCGAR